MSTWDRQPDRRPTGFVLLAVLMLLALVAVLLSELSRRSASQAGRAVEAHVELQRRWGMASVRNAVLPSAEAILKAHEEAGGEIREGVRAEITLGEQHITVTVADEQAKVNVNAMYHWLDPTEAEQQVRRLVPPQRAIAVELQPLDWPAPLALDADAEAASPSEDARPTANTASNNASEDDEPAEVFPTRFVGWHQVFRNPSPVDLFGDERLPAGATDQLTCWGDGRLHLDRASVEQLSLLTRGVLTPRQLSELRDLRRNDRDTNLASQLGKLDLPEEQQEEALERLTVRSRCHSVAMVARDRWRETHALAVAVLPDTDDEQDDPEKMKPPMLYRLQW